MPMIPMTGPQDPAGFGAQGPTSLGAGGLAGQEMMGGDPTDPSAQVQMGGMPPITPGGVAEAMQQAIEMRQATMQQAAQQQLVADLQEADAFIQQLMGVIGAEAMTLDGPGAVPAGPLPAPEMAPGAMESGPEGMPAAMMGEAGPNGTGQVTPEMLAQILGGMGMG